MKLLLDQNLSSRLVAILEDVYPGSARDNGYLIVSKDADFRQLSFLYGAPPKVVWIRFGNCSTQDIERTLRARAERIAEFDRDPDAAILVLA
jgi:predicted nuclease of predicted toxin-antitoxin system